MTLFFIKLGFVWISVNIGWAGARRRPKQSKPQKRSTGTHPIDLIVYKPVSWLVGKILQALKPVRDNADEKRLDH
jgi:hypothetical protein